MIKMDQEFIDTLKHSAEFRRALANNKFEETPEGLLFTEQGLLVRGLYSHEAPDGLGLLHDKNLIVTEGLNHVWSSTVAAGTQVTAWYVAIHSGTSSVSATWTAANYASNASELTSQYSEGARQAFTPSTPASGATNSLSNRAVFTAATTSVSVWGAALLSSSTKGGTSGVLLSATKFSAVRSLAETGDTVSIGITLSATSS